MLSSVKQNMYCLGCQANGVWMSRDLAVGSSTDRIVSGLPALPRGTNVRIATCFTFNKLYLIFRVGSENTVYRVTVDLGHVSKLPALPNEFEARIAACNDQYLWALCQPSKSTTQGDDTDTRVRVLQLDIRSPTQWQCTVLSDIFAIPQFFAYFAGRLLMVMNRSVLQYDPHTGMFSGEVSFAEQPVTIVYCTILGHYMHLIFINTHIYINLYTNEITRYPAAIQFQTIIMMNGRLWLTMYQHQGNYEFSHVNGWKRTLFTPLPLMHPACYFHLIAEGRLIDHK